MPSISTMAFSRSRFFSTRSSARVELCLKKRTSGEMTGVPFARKVPSRMHAWASWSRISVVF